MAYLRTTQILTAVREVLDDGTGNLRPIDASRFSDDLHQGASEQELQRRGAVAAKPLQVRLGPVRRHKQSGSINGSQQLYEAEIQVVVTRTVPPEAQVDSDVFAAIEAAALEDADAIAQALGTPGNLDETAAGTATDIVSGMLLHQGSSPVLLGAAKGAQRLETTHRFSGILISRPQV